MKKLILKSFFFKVVFIHVKQYSKRKTQNAKRKTQNAKRKSQIANRNITNLQHGPKL